MENASRVSSSQNLLSTVEFSVLKLLGLSETETQEVSSISSGSGVRDNDEVLRALYTLEGKNLVSPSPAGDFTSNNWRITEVGQRALRILRS